MKRIGSLLLLMAFIVTSCQLFPGYFIPWANQTAGISGTGQWNDLGDYSAFQIIHPNFREMLDMDVAANGEVLLGFIDSGGPFPQVWRYTPGAGWLQTPGLPYNTSGSFCRSISVAMMETNTTYRPHVAFTIPESNYTYVHDWDYPNNNWRPWPVNPMFQYNYAELVPSTYDNNTDNRVMVKHATNWSFMAISYDIYNSLSNSYGPSFHHLSVSHNIDNVEILVAVGDSTSIDIMGGGIGATPSSIFSIGGGFDQDFFSIEGHGSGANRKILMAHTSNNLVHVIEHYGSSLTSVTNMPFGNIRYMDTAFDYDRDIFYLAVIDSVGFIRTWAFDVQENRFRELGQEINDIESRILVLEHREGSAELYLAFGDGINQKVKVKMLVDR